MLDNKGPEVNLVLREEDDFSIVAGQELCLSVDPRAPASPQCLPVSNPAILDVLRPGDIINFSQYMFRGDDKAISLEVGRPVTLAMCVTFEMCAVWLSLELARRRIPTAYEPGCVYFS